MHHGDREYDGPSEEMLKARTDAITQKTEEILRQQAKELELGATGQYPDGKLKADDEGEIKIGVTNHNGKVFIAFGKLVEWIGLEPEQARELAEYIRKQSYL